MAIYPFKCEACKAQWDQMGSPLSDAPKKSTCPECGEAGKRVWTSFKVYQTSYFKTGWDPGLGKSFNSDRERNNYLAREKPKLRKLTSRPKGVII